MIKTEYCNKTYAFMQIQRHAFGANIENNCIILCVQVCSIENTFWKPNVRWDQIVFCYGPQWIVTIGSKMSFPKGAEVSF